MTQTEPMTTSKAKWSELFPEGRVIYYEGDDPEAFVAEIKAKFDFDPSKDALWEPSCGNGFVCPANLLDEIYGGQYPMGS